MEENEGKADEVDGEVEGEGFAAKIGEEMAVLIEEREADGLLKRAVGEEA